MFTMRYTTSQKLLLMAKEFKQAAYHLPDALKASFTYRNIKLKKMKFASKKNSPP